MKVTKYVDKRVFVKVEIDGHYNVGKNGNCNKAHTDCEPFFDFGNAVSENMKIKKILPPIRSWSL